jgi:hypothetical protein
MVDMLPKIQVNIVLSERNLEATIDAILRAAYPLIAFLIVACFS